MQRLRGKRHRFRLALVILPFLVAGCHGDEPASGSEPPTQDSVNRLTVGIVSDFEPGPDLIEIRASVRVTGEEERVFEQSFRLVDESLKLPLEVEIDDLGDGATVEIVVGGYRVQQPSTPFVTRTARTTAQSAGRHALLRVRMERECVPNLMLPSGKNAPDCDADKTCVAAYCEDPFIPFGVLEDYAKDWPVAKPDICNELSDEPAVTVGAGEEAFEELAATDELALEFGQQGGYHTWVSLQMTGLYQAGSTAFIGGTVGAYELERIAYPFSFDAPADGAGVCQLIGLRYPIFYDGLANQADLSAIWGEPVQLEVTVVDPTGDVAIGFVDALMPPAP